MAENVAPLTQPVNEQAVDTASESQKRGSATAGMFSDLTVDEIMRDDDDDDASTLSSYAASTSTSASMATEYRYEHGRRYHAFKDGKYTLPNDEREMDRLELQHIIWSAAFNGVLNLCPLSENMTDALDIGCGTGAWTIEFAHAHPNTAVLGTDLSPIQPNTVPINCTFIVDDATQNWAFHQRFDYIHTRAISMGIADWDKFIGQAYTFLKPGGWCELQEFHLSITSDDGSMKEGGALWTWRRDMLAATKKIGIDALASLQHPRMMKENGFINIGERQLKIPMGPWAKGRKEKQIGIMAQKDLAEGIEGISTKLLLMVGYEPETLTQFFEEVKKELMDPKVHSYMSIVISWGQKPLEAMAT